MASVPEGSANKGTMDAAFDASMTFWLNEVHRYQQHEYLLDFPFDGWNPVEARPAMAHSLVKSLANEVVQ